MLTAYFDESQSQDKSMTCVGGYVFDQNGLDQFNENWAGILRPLQAKGIRYFHASPCNARQEEFSSLNDAERRVLFGDLINVIRTNSKLGLVISLEDAVLEGVVERNKIQSYIGSKYTACALMAMQQIADWSKAEGYEEQISYNFEAGPLQQEADWMMNRIAENPELATRYRYGNHGFFLRILLSPYKRPIYWCGFSRGHGQKTNTLYFSRA